MIHTKSLSLFFIFLDMTVMYNDWCI